MDVAPEIYPELSAELIATLEKIQQSISCWIQQEKDCAVLHEEDIRSNYCALLSTIMGNDENSIRLCLFFFSRKMIDITLQTLGFTCSGQVRGFNSIIAVYPDKYSSTLTLQERLTSDTIKLLFVWERKIADANVGTPSIGEGTGRLRVRSNSQLLISWVVLLAL
jgi:hypothetical protein